MAGTFRALSRQECRQRLANGGVGRIAATASALPAIFPVNFAVSGDEIIFRTDAESTLASFADEIVGFEADLINNFEHGGWSVQVVGRARRITDPGELDAARRLPLRSWATMCEPVFMRISCQVMSGRELSQSVGDPGSA